MANGDALLSKTDVAFFFFVFAEATAAPGERVGAALIEGDIGVFDDGIKGGANGDAGDNDDNDDDDGVDDGDDEDVICADWTVIGGAEWYRQVVPLSAPGVVIGAALDNANGGSDDGTMDEIVTGTLSGAGDADCCGDVVEVDVDVEIS